MRQRWFFLHGLLMASLTLGCEPDPGPPCAQAYDHLAAIAKRSPSPARRQRFLSACTDAYDAPRHACLMEATSVEQALACRPKRAAPQ